MIRQAIILAAGKGSRLRQRSEDLPKPLYPVAGVSLLKRTILTLREGGVDRMIIVIGFMADRVRAALKGDSDLQGTELILAPNPDYQRQNGVSLLAARRHVDGPFLINMSDHVYEPSLVRRAAAADLATADLFLAVDRRVRGVYDLPDATKVRTDSGRIVEIGKSLSAYDAVDCGVFAASSPLFHTLARARAHWGDCSLSQGVQWLADRRRARVIDIGDAFWQDVDTPLARKRAERELARLSNQRRPPEPYLIGGSQWV